MVDGILNQVDVEAAILAAVEELEAATTNLRDLAIEAAEAEAQFKKDWAQALVRATAEGSKATEKTRVAEADLAASGQRLRYLLADKLYESQRSALRSLQTRIDALRTISANVRSLT